jgi:hypothetical protein
VRLVALALVAFVAIAIGIGSLRQPRRSGPELVTPDPVAAAHANARGIGLMEWFTRGDEAIAAFEEAVRLAPEWTPAKINLGIALLNRHEKSENLDRALGLFREILDQEPNNPHAHYCTGIIHYHRAQLAAAAPHFEAVTRIDPNDAHAWYWRGRCVPDSSESAEALAFFEKALKLNPYLNAARYAIAQHRVTVNDEKRQKQLIDEFQMMVRANVHDLTDLKYTEMGRYGEVIGKSPAPPPDLGPVPMFEAVKGPVVKLAEGTKWADMAHLKQDITRVVHGSGVALLDYNRDGKPDVLLLGAAIRDGHGGNLLLRNDGNNTFTDVTMEAGLGNRAVSYGAAVGDFDNDGFPDIALAEIHGVTLLRNIGGKGFKDETPAVMRKKEPPDIFLCVTWVDLDQDGDLDLVAGQSLPGALVVFLNVGVAPPSNPGQPVPPLSVAFQRADGPEALLVKESFTGIIATDVDGDFDIDLILLAGGSLVTILNDRLLRFRRGERLTDRDWVSGMVLDANGDDQSDIVLLEPKVAPRILVSKQDAPGENVAARFGPGNTDSPPLRSAAWCDLDLDGRTDLVGLSADGKPVFLQGDGNGKFTRKNEPFGPQAEAIPDLLAVVPVDLDGDCNPDILAWSASGGLHVFRSLGNGNHGMKVQLTGRRLTVAPGDESKPLRTNADAVGAWVRLHAGPLRTAAENTTLFAGLGQSRLPLHFGLGKLDTVDALRVRWPDSVIQAELNQGGCNVTVVELNRKPSSCPILFTWDGERFAYVTDFLGAGSVGESGPDGSVRPPRPEESVKIEPGRLVAKNGKFILKVGEPMDEVMYLDRLRLDVIDHPAGVSVFPDERFATTDPQPTQERLFFRDSERVFAARTTDHRGRDVTAALRDRDGRHVEGFALRSWLGFAEDHFVELDFNGQLKSLPAGRKVYLVLAGWTDYAFPESIYAATQAGVPPVWPVLEQKQRDGTWKNLGEIGLPAGLTRVMTTDITGRIDPAGGPVRIRTNLQIYWDQVFVAPVADGLGNFVRELPISRASLEHRGFTQEYSPGGKLPIAYDYDRLEPVVVTRWRGRLTRTGDVTELLAETDDRHVVCGPGDEVTAEFDAVSLPPLREGWQRSFVLRSWGYCKDAAPTTLTGGSVGPLPYRAMPKFPYDPAKEPPPARVTEYDRVWNTRPAGRR